MKPTKDKKEKPVIRAHVNIERQININQLQHYHRLILEINMIKHGWTTWTILYKCEVVAHGYLSSQLKTDD